MEIPFKQQKVIVKLARSIGPYAVRGPLAYRAFHRGSAFFGKIKAK